MDREEKIERCEEALHKSIYIDNTRYCRVYGRIVGGCGDCAFYHGLPTLADVCVDLLGDEYIKE